MFYVEASIVLELVDTKIEQRIVKVLTSQVSISIRTQNFEFTLILNTEHCNIKSTAAEIVHHYVFFLVTHLLYPVC